MLEVSQIRECKQMAGRGVPIREISKRLGVARNTIRRYLRGAEPGVYQLKASRPTPAQDEVRDRVRALLVAERDAKTPRKQRLTAARIYRLLVDGEEKAKVSERTVRTVVRELRLQLRDQLEHAYLPLQYDPGQDAQVDFMEAEVDDAEEGRVKRFVLIVRACYSGHAFRYVAPNQTREALLEGLMQAFEYFGGVIRCLWFDNFTAAVKRVLKGRNRELQHAFESFQAHYGFQAEFCRPGRGNEKGGVENNVRHTRSEGFTPIPQVCGREELQKQLLLLSEKELGRVPRHGQHSIGVLWSHEQGELLPLPPSRFEASTTRTTVVTKRSWVQMGTNFYSVPVRLVGHQVTMKTSAEEVVILDRTGEVARHCRCYGNGRMVLELEHYLPLLQRKHRGLDRAVPMRQWLTRVSVCWQQLLVALRARAGEVEGSKEFLDVVALCGHYGLDSTTQAVEHALLTPNVALAVVRYHLGLQEEEQRPPVEAIDFDGPDVQQGSAAAYAEVMCG